MKYLIYTTLALIACALFMPRTGTTKIRNLPLLIVILFFVLIWILIRFFKYVVFMMRTKKMLQKNGFNRIKSKFFPWSSCFHGRYSITFQHEEQTVQIVLISRRWKYQRYHFESIDRLEFYRANRVVFNSIETYGGTISKLVEINRVGKQHIQWEDSAVIRVVLFDKLPNEITDSAKKENIASGERICNSNVYVLDWYSFLNAFFTVGVK